MFANGSFTLSLAQLGGVAGAAATCKAAGLVDEVLSKDPATKSGYTFTYVPNGVAALTTGIPVACGPSGDTGFSVSAGPISLSTGTAAYCIDETGVIRVDSGATAGEVIPAPCSTSKFPPLQ